MMIYHQHADINYWDINSQHPQQFYPVAANCQYSIPTHAGEYGSINSTSCPWLMRSDRGKHGMIYTEL